MTTWRIGEVRLGGPLGEGGMGCVYEGRLGEADTPVAVKVLNEAGLRNRATQLAFGNEVRAVAALNHPGVIPILDYGELPAGGPDGLPEGSPYLVMPLAPGGTASALRGRLSFVELRALLLRVLDALAHAHSRGVLHRDIKPSNILMRDAHDPSAGLWLADFGLAVLDLNLYPDAALLQGGGTKGYRAPEQASPGRHPEGPWTDLYAVGMVAARLADTWDGPIDAPAGFWDWLTWLSADEVGARPRFAAQAAQGLRALPPEAPPESVTPRWREEPARSPLEPSMSLRVLALREPGLVGRDAERDRLWSALLDVRARRRPAGVRIVGPRGLGRSRLARWLAEQAHQRGLARAAIVSLSPSPGARDPVAACVARVLGLEGLYRDARRHLLEQALSPRGWTSAELDRLETLSTRQAGLQLAVRVGSSPDRAGLLRRALLDLARAHPLVLVLDDLHDDPDAAALADSLLSGAGDEGAALLLVQTTTPEGQRVLPDRWGAPSEQLTLAPLSEAEHLRLLREMLGHRRARLGEIAARSAGDPGFAVQLARSLSESQSVTGRLPDALQDVYTLRLLRCLSGLKLPERRAAFVAALLGASPEPEEWRQVCASLQLSHSERALEALARAGLLTQGPEGLRFLTPLVAETLAGLAADEGEAEALHAACAEVVDEDAHPERVGQHRLGAGQDERALAPLTEALSRQVTIHHRLERGARLAESLRELLGRVHVPAEDPLRLEAELQLARLHYAARDTEQAWAGLRALIPRAARAGQRERELRARHLYSYRRWHRGDYEGQLQELTGLLELAEGVHRAELLRTMAFVTRAAGRGEEAMALAEQALPLLEASGDEVGAVDVLRLQASYRAQADPGPEALALAEAMRQRAARAGFTYFVGVAWNNVAILQDRMGDLPAAARSLERAMETLDSIGAPDRVLPRVNQGTLQVRLGHPGEARATLESCYRYLGAQYHTGGQGYVAVWLCRVLAELGDWAAIDPTWSEADLSMVAVSPQMVIEPLVCALSLAEQAGVQAPTATIRAMLTAAKARCPDEALRARAQAALSVGAAREA